MTPLGGSRVAGTLLGRQGKGNKGMLTTSTVRYSQFDLLSQQALQRSNLYI